MTKQALQVARRALERADQALSSATQHTWDSRLYAYLELIATNSVLAEIATPLREEAVDPALWWEKREGEWAATGGRSPISGPGEASQAAFSLQLLGWLREQNWVFVKYVALLTGTAGSWTDRVAKVYDSLVVPLTHFLENSLDNAEEGVDANKRIGSSLRPLERLFLSHAAADRGCAEFVRAELEGSIRRLRVFQTSAPGMIASGADWLASIKRELDEADGYVILLTPQSVARPWIWFETGAAWMSKRPMATVSAGGLDRARVRMPLASFQMLSLEDPGRRVFSSRSLVECFKRPTVSRSR